jgi:hippurate hydrolase
MDALPLEEKTGLPFSSKVKGFMHACGHDGHIAAVLGAAELLMKSPPAGNVVFLFQPGEEGGGGAQKMIEEGALDGVDMIFGGHIDGHFKVGEIAIRKGTETSYTDGLQIRILGKGGHAARPHEAVDAVMVSSLFVLELQNIISRGIDPLNPTVITIGSLHSGTAHNVIAEEAVMHGTIRNTDGNTRKQVIKRIKKTASALATLHDADIGVEITQGYPPVVNRPEAYKIAMDAAEMTLGREKVINLAKPSMGGEDFAYFLQKISGCFVRIGARGRETKTPTAHSSYFDFDEEAIRVGAAFFARTVKAAIDEIIQGRIRD